jgi:hypothetical protein
VAAPIRAAHAAMPTGAVVAAPVQSCSADTAQAVSARAIAPSTPARAPRAGSVI